MNHIVYLGNNVVERRNIEKTLTEHGYSVINFRYLPEITNPLALVIVSRDDKTSTAEIGWSSEEIQNPILTISHALSPSKTMFQPELKEWEITRSRSLPTPVHFDLLCHENWINACQKAQHEPSYDHNVLIVQRACHYIETHIDDNFTLKQIADYVGTNRTYLTRMFKGVMGITVFNWIKKLRMLKAASLLHETKNSVTDIALDVGIRQVSNFSKMFKSYSGVAPNQFRKSL